MGELIDDEILNTFAVVGPPEDDRARSCTAATATSIDRISFYAPYRSDPERWAKVLDDIKAA